MPVRSSGSRMPRRCWLLPTIEMRRAMMPRLYLIALAFFICQLASHRAVAQSCPINITVSVGPGGQVSFFATPTATGNLYAWNFGNNTFNSGLGLWQTSATYTSVGIYTATCSFTSTSPPCMSNASVVFTVNTICSLNVSQTAPNPPSACNGSAVAVSLGGCAGTTYSWSNGYSGNNPTNLCPNTIYTVTAISPATCCPVMTQTVLLPGCNLVANFTSAFTPTPGTHQFTSISTGTIPTTSYTWSFGDGGFSTNSLTVLHTYTANGNYSVTLLASNGGSLNCNDDSTRVVTITGIPVCSVQAAFNASIGNFGAATFSNTSTGTLATTSYSWSYGDGFGSTGTNAQHTYSFNNVYQVTLTAINNSTCTNTTVQSVTVSTIPVPCALSANYTHTVTAPGIVNFNSTSTGTANNTYYTWNFGDGTTGPSATPTHTYVSDGAYTVSLIAVTPNVLDTCRDTSTAVLNITGLGCMANAHFFVGQGASPIQWMATVINPWTVTNAVWQWGDGSSSSGLFSSHTYSNGGYYTVCLSVTVSCGAIDSFCTLANLSSQATGPVYLNTQAPALTNGLSQETLQDTQTRIFPNPNRGQFHVLVKTSETGVYRLCILDLEGRTVHAADLEVRNGEQAFLVDDTALADGVYVVQVVHGEQVFRHKLVVHSAGH